MPVVVTAGHVDHGKSTLVRALTGRDPDRWIEEKRRGLTIDLGFAWTTIGDHEVAFVDVPGHERFIKNMLAGVGAVDAALFVVAADEGWMPQSEEHLAVLETLGIHRGLIVLTRLDLIGSDLVVLAETEVRERTAGTALAEWPVVAVSATTGVGLERLRTALESMFDLAAGADTATAEPGTGWARMWVDRVFVAPGAGVVATGTTEGGDMHRGGLLTVWPGGGAARIRSIQSHETEVAKVGPGVRTALNLSGVERSDIGRGSLLASPGTLQTTRRLLAHLVAARSWPGAIGDRGAFHLHAGTGHWPIRVRLLGGPAGPAPGAAVLHLEGAAPLRMGDRFVIRDVGRRAVVGGGVVLDPHPGRDLPRADEFDALRCAVDGGRNLMADRLLDIRGSADLSYLAADTGGGIPEAAVVAGGVAMTSSHLAELAAAMTDEVMLFHRRYPMRPGIPRATLASAAGVSAAVVDAVLNLPGNGLREDGGTLAAVDFHPVWGTDEETAWAEAAARLTADAPSVPTLSTLGLDPEILHVIVRQGRVTMVGDDFAYLPEQLDAIVARTNDLDDPFTLAEFRDLLGVSRRHAVPLLEWMDTAGITVRSGDTRTFRRPLPPPADGVPTR